MTRLLLLLTVTLAGCAHPAAPPARSAAAGTVQGQSLAGDLLGMVGPFAAKKAIQAAISAALKKDAKTVATFRSDVAHTPEAAQVDYLKKRIGTLQKAIAAAELALVPLKNVDAAHEALAALKHEDEQRAKVADKSPAALLAWGDALAAGLETFKGTF
jgi:hypothetical protein